MSTGHESKYTEVLGRRIAALDAIFGKRALYIASPVPFYLGGDATIIAYADYLQGHTVYCTSEMTGNWGAGQKPGPIGEFELVMVLPNGSPLAPTSAEGGLIRKGWLGVTLHGFAKYSTQVTLAPGDLAGPLPDAFSPHTHLLLVDLTAGRVKFGFGDRQYGLVLLISISEPERKFHAEHGGAALLKLLRQAGTFPVTNPARRNVV